MGLFKVFRIPAHQRFDFTPRYWDREKEELEKRLGMHTGDTDTEMMKERISARFKGSRRMEDKTFGAKQVKRSNLVLILVIVFLLFLSYVGINEFLPQLLRFLE